MKKTLYLIDGSAYLYRAFHAIRSLSTSKGLPTNATFGFTRILLKLIKEKNPDYAVVFFDVKGPTFRHEMYGDYKANRPPMPDELAIQIPYIKEVVSGLNIAIIEKQGFEADDLIGTMARIAQDQGYDSVMVTGDKDFMQLVNDSAVIWDPMKETVIDTAFIKDKLNIIPEQVIDMLGLSGDASDNVPGVPGIGPKTAQKLINQFGSIEKIYDNLDSLKKKKSLHKKLMENRDQAFLSRDLVTIDRFVPVDTAIDEFKLKPFDDEQLAKLFRKLEFRKLYQEFAQKNEVPKNYSAITDIDKVTAIAETLAMQTEFAIDTETTSKHPMLADLVGISFSFKEHQAFYIPVGHVNSQGYQQPEKETVLRILKPVLENPAISKIGQNIKYDIIVLAKCGIQMQGIAFDTMIASHLLNPAVRGHSLDRIAMELLGHKTISYQEITGKGKHQIGFQEVAIKNAVNYACEDADITFLAYKILKKTIDENQLSDLMQTVEIPLVQVLATMEMHGIKLDTEKLKRLSKTFEDELSLLAKEIFALAGEEFNINSSKQLGNILFEKLELPVQKKTKKKTGYSTDADVLSKLAGHHELPGKVLRFRTLGKLKSTYSDSLQQLVHPQTRRIHTSFNQSITATGRLSSSDPNLQNIPIRTREGQKIRQAFIPEHGCVLVAADYSQIELRILAHCANDEILIEAFNNDEDIHTRTAAEVFQVFPEFITPELRQQAKAINFGIVYGMSAFGLSKELDISRKMAQTYINHYFTRYAGVKRFINATIERAKETSEVTTLLGRKRRLEEIHASNTNVRNFAERAAINTPIQGSAADLIKLAMINMDTALKEKKLASKMLVSVHDEILFETPLEEKETLVALARKVMEGVFELKVPLKVNIDSGENWAQAH